MSRIPSLGPRGEGWLFLQMALLLSIVVAGFLFPGAWPSGVETIARVGGTVLILGGIALLVASVVALGPSLSPLPQPAPGSQLIDHGPYRWLRHPIYSALVTAGAGGAIYTASLAAGLLTVVLAVVLDLKARREEEWLRERYPDYAAYALRTKRFIPALY